MRVLPTLFTAATVALLAAASAQASPVQAELHVGEPGFTLSVRGPLQPDVSWRLDAAHGTRHLNRTFHGNDFDVTWTPRRSRTSSTTRCAPSTGFPRRRSA